MATVALQRLEDQISCSVCLDRYVEPKQLQCHHVNCKSCLEGLLKRAPNKAVLICPICRKETPIPREGGVSALGAAFHINDLMELWDSLHSEVTRSMSRRSSMRSNNTSSIDSMSSMGSTASSMGSMGSTASSMVTSGKPTGNASMRSEVGKQRPRLKFMCQLHEKSELQLYCKSCDEVICIKCTIKEHHGHKYELVEEVVGEHKRAMTGKIEKVNDMAEEIEKTLIACDSRNEEVGIFRTSIEGDIHTVFEDLHEVLRTREHELIQHLDKIVERKLKSLAAERDIKETVLLQANNCASQVGETLKAKSDIEVLCTEKSLMQKLDETMSLYQVYPDLLEVSMEADIVLSVPPDLTPQCKSFGHILTPESIDPQKCIARGRGVEAAVIDKKAVIFMKVQDLKGNPSLKSIPDMECSVIFVRTGRATKCEVRKGTENVYEISYIPVVRGAHEVHIKIDNRHVRGSPFPVVVQSPAENLGKCTKVMDDMIQPWGIVINQKDQIIISECDGHQVAVFTRDGKKIRSIGTQGRKPLKWPRGIALDGMGNIFVAEMGNHRVQKFNIQGQLLASAGTVGKGREQFQDPKGLAFNFVNNKVYVADVNRVQVMNSDLTFHGMPSASHATTGAMCTSATRKTGTSRCSRQRASF